MKYFVPLGLSLFPSHGSPDDTPSLWSPPGIEKNLFFQISLEAYHLNAILRVDHEYRIFISIALSFVPEKCILLLSGL